MTLLKTLLTTVGLTSAATSATTIADITGDRYLSPLNGTGMKTGSSYRQGNTDFFSHLLGVANVSGLVTAKGPNGFWIRSPEPDNNDRTSER